MKPLNEILAKMDAAIEKYDTCKLALTHEQSEILRDLSTSIYFLTAHKNKYHEDWLSVYFNSKGTSVAAKEREADHKVPELYMIRQFMDSGKKVLESMRSTLSANKTG